MNKNEVTKQLMKSKVMAKFSHYTSGSLYYTVELIEGTYQFPIPTVEFDYDSVNEDKGESGNFQLSSDLGTTSFYNEMRGSELNRWILKSMDSDEFIKVK
jgi:hypothetical protein